MYMLILFLIMIIITPSWAIDNEPFNPLPDSNSSTFRTKSRTFWQNELPDVFSRHFPGGWVTSGGLHGATLSCTSSPFSTEAFTSAGNRVRAIAGNNPDSSSGAGPGSSIAINYSTTGCDCAVSDIAWVIISGQSGNSTGNFTRATGSNYFINCTDAFRPVLPADSAWLMSLTMGGGALSPPTDLRTLAPGGPEGDNSHSTTQIFSEMSRWWQDAFQSYVTEDCLHPTSGTTSAVIQTCRAYIFNQIAVYVKDTLPRTINYSAGDGVYWLVAHTDTSSVIAGWQRTFGTRYLWKYESVLPVGFTMPEIPFNMILLARVTVTLGAITSVGDFRQDSPIHGRPFNILSPLYNVIGDDVTDDTAAIQAVLNAASWQRRRAVSVPMAPLGACYAVGRLFFHHDVFDNPGWNPDTNAQGRIVLTGDGSFTLRDAIQNISFGSCLRTTDATGPGFNIFSQVGDEATVTNSQRTEFRDIHFKGSNTTAIIRVDATTTNSWQNVSVNQQDNTVGNGVDIWDSFLFQWEGGAVLGAAVLPTGTGVGVHLRMPVNTVAGLVEFRNMTARRWGDCWKFGDDIATSNRLLNLKFHQVQAKDCSNHAMLLLNELRAVSISDSYFEGYVSGLSIAGNNRAIKIESNYFAGTFVNPGRANVAIGIGTLVNSPKTARQVVIRSNSFSSVAVGTTGVRLDVRNTADNGREIAFNEFVGNGPSVEIVSDGGNLHQLYIYGNDWGTSVTPILFTDMSPGLPDEPDGRIDFLGQDGFSVIGALQQRLIGSRVDILNTDTTILLNQSANLQRFQVTGGTATVNTITWIGGTPVTGTEFCLLREQSSTNLTLQEGGNIQLDGGTSKTLTAEGSSICFYFFDGEYQQSRAMVQHN